MACRQPWTLESSPRRPSWAQSPTCLIEDRVSQPQPLLGTLDIVVIMTDEDKTEMESSRPSPLDPAPEQAQPRQLTRDNQEWFSSFQQPAERLPYDSVEDSSKHSRSPRRRPQLLLRCRKAAQQRCTAKPNSVSRTAPSKAVQRQRALHRFCCTAANTCSSQRHNKGNDQISSTLASSTLAASLQHLRTHLADLQPQSHLRLPDLHGITWLCSTAGLFVSNLRI